MAEFALKPIGFFNGSRTQKSAIPRQGIISKQTGFIEFRGPFDYKLALKGLEKMSHCWLIFLFHETKDHPKPLVRPPRSPDIQVGVWATRSPYRPNSLGLTLAKIEKIDAGKLFLSSVDLLHETPILDIKPYVTESDVAQKPKLGWIDEVEIWKYRLSQKAKKQVQWLEQNGLEEIKDVLESQFGTPPLQPDRKRVKSSGKNYVLAYRTWRFHFSINKQKLLSEISEIKSGYTLKELHDGGESDLYQDKEIHQKFSQLFL